MWLGWRAYSVALIVAASLVLALPLFLQGFPLGHDSVWHLVYQKYFAEQFWEGELYPRWLAGANAGLGSPNFFVYGPLPYWVGSLTRPLAIWLEVAQPEAFQLTLSMFLGLLASGLAAYLWLRMAHQEVVAAAGAVIYMLMPYHLVTDLYIRAALPEFWAFVWMPLILYFIRRVVEGRRFALVGLATTYGLLVMTHLFTTLLFSIWAILYAWLFLPEARKWARLVRALSGLGLGLGLAAIYLGPALAHEQYMPISRRNLAPKYYYANNFLGSSLTGDDGITIITLLTLIMGGFAFIRTRPAPAKHLARERWFWLAGSLCCVLMMLPISQPLWRLLPLLQGLQFPWRFNTVLVVSTTALMAMATGMLHRRAARPALLGLTLVPWVLVMSIVGSVKVAELRHRNAAEVDFYFSVGYEIHTLLWVSGTDWGPDAPQQVRRVSRELGLVRAEDRGHASVLKWAPRDIRLRVRSERGGAVVVGQLYYPGWEAHEATSGAPLKVEATLREGLVRVWVPAGEHEVALRLCGGPSEELGTALSGACLGVLVILYVRAWTRERASRAGATPCCENRRSGESA